MPPRKNSAGRWECQFWTPANALGVKLRKYVVCPPSNNTALFCRHLVRTAIERHVGGIPDEAVSFERFTVDKFFVEYPAARNLRPSSTKLVDYLLRKNAFPELGALPLPAVDATAVARLCGKMREAARPDGARRYSDQTIRLTTIAVASVLRWAHRTGALGAMPAVVLPKVPEAQRPTPYTREEAQRLIAAATDDDQRVAFLLTFDGGLRKGETLGLCWEQIDFQRHVMLIDRQLYRGDARQTKGGRARYIPMSGALEAALREVRHLRGPHVLSDADGRPLGESQIRTWFRRARVAAGLRKVRWHDGRHTFSTLRTDEGTNPFALQQLLGHRDVRTTQRYVHSSTATVRSVLDEPGET